MPRSRHPTPTRGKWLQVSLWGPDCLAYQGLVVSHFYHLPRIKLAYQRDGWDVYTVPAKESYLLRQMPYNMAREVAALWVYYLRPLGRA